MTCFNLAFGNQEIYLLIVRENQVYIKCNSRFEPKLELVTELLVCKMDTKKFYNLLNEKQKGSVLAVWFELTQNQPLPKSSIDKAYDSTRLWQFFLGVLVHRTGEYCLMDGVSMSKLEEKTLLRVLSLTLLRSD